MNIALKLFDMWFSLQKLLLKSFDFVPSNLSVISSICSSVYETRFLELVRPRLAVLERRDRTGVAVGGDVSLGQPCWSKISMQPLLPVFLAILMAVWPWLSFAFTSIPYCGQTEITCSSSIYCL